MPDKLDNRAYYDEFASWYENERGRGYHQMLDDLEVEIVERYGRGGRVLEVGCGTGLILERVEQFSSATGMDLSGGMLAKARGRGLEVTQGSATALPYANDSFDCVYSFKVLAHVDDIRTAMSEMSRVTRPGGWVLAEFYNPMSLRGLIKKLKPASAISSTTNDEAVYTRYDSLDTIRSYLPPDLRLETVRGVRVVTPFAYVHKLPVLGGLFRAAEHALADAPVARRFGGFLVAIAQKR